MSNASLTIPPLTLARALAVFQPLDGDLTTLAALAPADGTFIRRTGGAWVAAALVSADMTTVLASPPAIGGTTPAAVTGTTIIANTALQLTATGDSARTFTISNSTRSGGIIQRASGTDGGRLEIFSGNNQDVTIFGTGGTAWLRLTSSLATFIGGITTTGNLTVASDTDATTILGRARISSPLSDYAHFGHFDMSGGGQIALRQSPAGATIVNSATGQNLSLTINGTSIITVNSSSAGITQPTTVTVTDAATATVTNVETLLHSSSGTPAASYGTGLLIQGHSSTNTNRDMARMRSFWTTPTDASRVANLILSVWNISSEVDVIQLAPTSMSVLPDTDADTRLGRTRIDSRTSDNLFISHYDMSTTANFALKQDASGATTVNTASGQSLLLRVAGATTAVNIGASDITNLLPVFNRVTDAATATVTNVLTLQHETSGTPAGNYGTGLLIQGESSTTSNRDMGRLRTLWTTATDASRIANLVLSVWNIGVETDVLTLTPTTATFVANVNLNALTNSYRIAGRQVIAPATDVLKFADHASWTDVVFNESASDTNFRIEGVGDANLFVLDAGLDLVSIGEAVVSGAKLNVNGLLRTNSFRIDQAPVSEAIVPTHTITINVNGTDYKIAVQAA